MSDHTLLFDLPWPPSVNRYWRNVKGRVLVSREGRAYRTLVCLRLMGTKGVGLSRVGVSIVAHPPDRRRRDLDNLQKAPLDAMTKAGIWADDSQIDALNVVRGAVVKGGIYRVKITVLEVQ